MREFSGKMVKFIELCTSQKVNLSMIILKLKKCKSNQKVSDLTYSKILLFLSVILKLTLIHSDWCGSVGWTLSCKLKSDQFDSQSGYMPRLWVKSPVGWHLRGNHTLMFLSLSFSLPSSLSLKINKINKIF